MLIIIFPNEHLSTHQIFNTKINTVIKGLPYKATLEPYPLLLCCFSEKKSTDHHPLIINLKKSFS